MSARLTILGLIVGSAIGLAACSGTSSPSAAAPSVAPSVAPAASPSEAASASTEASASVSTSGSGSAELQGFCADFTSKLAASWPNVDASTATTLGPIVREWSTNAAASGIAADAKVVFDWLAVASIGTTTASPPPDVMTAFDHIKAFADSNC